jgi:hypothetical protein
MISLAINQAYSDVKYTPENEHPAHGKQASELLTD